MGQQRPERRTLRGVLVCVADGARSNRGKILRQRFLKVDRFLSFELFRTGKWIPRSTRIDLAKDDIKLETSPTTL